jgi:hypothetical protein
MRKKKINRVLAISVVVFCLCLALALKIAFTPPRFAAGEGKAVPPPPAKKNPPWSAVSDPAQFDKVLASNFFVGSQANFRSQAGRAGSSGRPQALGKNEIRDEDTDQTFKFLGTAGLPNAPVAFFMRLEKPAKGEAKFLFLSRGERLGKSLLVAAIGEKGVTVRRGEETIELKIFDVEIKPLGSKAEDQPAQPRIKNQT